MKTWQHLLTLITNSIPPVHKEGYRFIFIGLVVTILLALLAEPLGWFGMIVMVWMVYFFRDPERVTPQEAGLVVSPADGVVCAVEHNIFAPDELGMGEKKFNRISVFLNVFDVHVNRIPIGGKIARLNYRPGLFLSADMEKASSDNERQAVVIETEEGKTVICVQIAGMVARRIVCNLMEEQIVETGERYGIIRFGSRADIYVPHNVTPQVIIGQRMVGGETVLAHLDKKLPERIGKKH